MFTDCPSCESQFRIRAAQLGAADGWVRCGKCDETFYALERLHDTPVKQAPLLPRSDEVVVEALTQSIRPTQQQPGTGEPILQSVEPEQPVEAEPVPQGVEPEQQVETVQRADEALTPRQESIEAETTATDENREALPDLPAVLADDKEKKTGSPARALWGSLVFVLSLVAVLQLAWFNRDGLLRAYPALVPWVEQMCESMQCDLVRFRDISAIELLDRQVSQHPRYRNALLASATMVNNAEFIQRFPDIELLIFASDGQVVSRGRFKPGEYLNPGVSPSSGMPPGVPIHFGLDLDGAAGDAVSFRFRFH